MEDKLQSITDKLKSEGIDKTMQPGTYTILTGNALDPKYPNKLKVTGDIKSVRSYLDIRAISKDDSPLQAVDFNNAIILINKVKGTITLQNNPNDPFGTEVEGVLLPDVSLAPFCINTNQQFTREQLVKIFRFNRRLFAQDKFQSILDAYLKLDLSGSTNFKDENDNRGNKEIFFKKVIDSSKVPTEFVLTCPIFKGFGAESFRVEICLEATDASVRFWFESVELAELIETRKEEIFSEQLAPYLTRLVIINQ